MTLSDIAVRKAKPAEKAYKIPDEKGLFLLVHPNGSKYWRQKYRYGGKEKMLAHGVYPDIGLKDARERRDEARKMLANGIDPGENRKARKAATQLRAANSFEVIGREWFEKNHATWADSHADKIIQRLEKDVFPWLGARPIAEITAPDVLAVLRRIEGRGALDTAHRAGGNCSQIFRYAIATGRAERDPLPDLKGALPPAIGKNFPAITDPAEVATCSPLFIDKIAMTIALDDETASDEISNWIVEDSDSFLGYRVSRTRGGRFYWYSKKIVFDEDRECSVLVELDRRTGVVERLEVQHGEDAESEPDIDICAIRCVFRLIPTSSSFSSSTSSSHLIPSSRSDSS